MAYFSRIDDYQTYSGQDTDFHYAYNANSGGGQTFLGGKFLHDGQLRTASSLNGKTAYFRVNFQDTHGQHHSILLNHEEEDEYPITPRGKDNTNMKLGLQGKTRPSLLLPALLMLPPTCSINMADSLDVSPLTKNNYWLRSMWMNCEYSNDGMVQLIPRDFVFEGGQKKDAANNNRPTGTSVFFKLDFERRMRDIVALTDITNAFDASIGSVLDYFRDVYLGEADFLYGKANSSVLRLMAITAHEYPETYSGYGDPLPTLEAAAYQNRNSVAQQPPLMSTSIHEPHNLIFFGAPGTGKSYQLDKLGLRSKDNAGGLFSEDHVRRVTFYPDYTYSQFVGSYRPYTKGNDIGYHYVAGPFLETYLDASTHPNDSYLLIIEEINRANPAAVFGDVFQLLDRNGSGLSEYSVSVPDDMADCIGGYLDNLQPEEQRALEDYFEPDLDFEELRDAFLKQIEIPPNMYIWATMNSADQGVFPMDTAFKRRWDFRYIGINDGENADVNDGKKLSDITVTIAGRRINWNALRKVINRLLLDNRINEDKLLGPFFVKPQALLDDDAFGSAFKDKILLYFYEDAAKMCRSEIFASENATYSEICRDFDARGVGVFNKSLDRSGLYAEEPDIIDHPDSE